MTREELDEKQSLAGADEAASSSGISRHQNSIQSMAEEPAGSMAGQLINERYLLVHLIGTGGWSEVYEAFDQQLNRKVAVKILYQHLSWKSDSLRRFQIEAEAAAKIEHGNVVAIYDLGFLKGGQPFIVMQLVEGTTLKAQQTALGELPWPEAVEIFLSVCDGLEAAHKMGVIHRDIKPSNVLISSSDGSIKLTDFGLAKQLNLDVASSLTNTGETIGTPFYMSPEQCKGEAVDLRSDIYSFGCLMYETLSGQMPFSGNTLFEVLVNQVNYEPPALVTEARRSMPLDLEAVVLKCLSKRAQDRYSTVQELRDDLKKVKDGVPVGFRVDRAAVTGVRDLRAHRSSRRPLLRWAGAGCLLLFLTFALVSGGLSPGVKIQALTGFESSHGVFNPVRGPGLADLNPGQTLFLPVFNSSGMLYRRAWQTMKEKESGFRTYNYAGMLLNEGGLTSFSASETLDPEKQISESSISYGGKMSAVFLHPKGKEMIDNIRSIDTIHQENGYLETVVRSHNAPDSIFQVRENAQVDSFSAAETMQ
ncbi:MAG: serine/threonine protein kinase [Candidatus Melainabacteria bacterium]|nr:serine/threonine protein kinase [Candidatus Melainabacteria bacterium]